MEITADCFDLRSFFCLVTKITPGGFKSVLLVILMQLISFVVYACLTFDVTLYKKYFFPHSLSCLW